MSIEIIEDDVCEACWNPACQGLCDVCQTAPVAVGVDSHMCAECDELTDPAKQTLGEDPEAGAQALFSLGITPGELEALRRSLGVSAA